MASRGRNSRADTNLHPNHFVQARSAAPPYGLSSARRARAHCASRPKARTPQAPRGGTSKCRGRNPACPAALAFAHLADPVHAVVPVARADQRQAVFADSEALIE